MYFSIYRNSDRTGANRASASRKITLAQTCLTIRSSTNYFSKEIRSNPWINLRSSKAKISARHPDKVKKTFGLCQIG